MKKARHALLAAFTCFAVIFTLGVFHLKNRPGGPVTLSAAPVYAVSCAEDAININTADHKTLTTLPGIGQVLAQRIIDYRESAGDFRAVEELMNIDGIGEKRMEQLLDLVTIGG